MAANDYYNTGYPPQSSNPYAQDTSYHGGGRTNAPLPPVPASPSPHPPYQPTVDTSYGGHSGQHGVNSPFDDNTYPSHKPGRESPNYYGRPGQGYNDPFGDSNAIPLQDQGKDHKHPGMMASPTDAEHGRIGHEDSDRRRRRRKQKDGWFKGKITWAVYILSIIQIAVFIAEIVKNATLTGSPIQTKPYFNPMIGPTPYVLINMGARYVPCMREVNVTLGGAQTPIANPEINMQCPNSTSNEAHCHLQDLCGFGMDLTPGSDGVAPQPNQWFRFITPIFLHGGIIHIGFNMLLQLLLGRDIERQIGTVRFLLVYFSAGIFGFVFGGNFAPNGVPSTGCSGSLFGIIALVLLDLLYTWKSRKSPVRDLLFIMLDIVISFVLGLLPGLDNFSHIGGFIVGIMLGICLLHSPDALRERIGLDDAKYATVPLGHDGEDPKSEARAFAKQPVGFFKGRKPLWWAWWLIRAGALVLFVVAFALLINNFYVGEKTCAWCKYLSCLPIKDWCDIGNLEVETTPNPARMLLRS